MDQIISKLLQKDHTISSEATPEEVSSNKSSLKQVCHNQQIEFEMPETNFKASLVSQDSEIVEFHFDQSDSNLANSEMIKAFEEERLNCKLPKNADLENSGIRCGWWCFDLDQSRHSEKCIVT